jgi:predicted nuclease with TOPRIM domain
LIIESLNKRLDSTAEDFKDEIEEMNERLKVVLEKNNELETDLEDLRADYEKGKLKSLINYFNQCLINLYFHI